ncbi:MAG: hypothetical protein K6G92_08405 [Bacteroidaceae bacterium]|nr:hypothetical protein [Bacteroidaceae bacterium]
MKNRIYKQFSIRAAMTLAVMMLTATTAWAQTRYSVSYINADGNSATCEMADAVSIYMEGTSQFSSSFHWLVVDNDITLNGASNSSWSDQNLILGDGKTLTINGQMNFSYNGSLNIYAQSGGTGKLVVSGDCANQGALQVPNGKTLTINGGTVELTNTNSNGFALRGNLVMNGGNLTAGGSCDGISGNTTINWKNNTDSIKPKNYGGNVTFADGK